MRIGIIGAGAAGSATARFLARDGHSVTLFEQFHLDHDRGSSFGPSRIIRRTYPDKLYTKLMDEAYRLWDELEDESGLELRLPTGGIYFGPEDHPDVIEAASSMDAAKVDYERLPCQEVQARFPAFRMKENEVALYQKDMGILRASECVRAQVRLAHEHGANFKETKKIVEIVSEIGGVRVRSEDDENFVFDRVAVTAGPWTQTLIGGFPLPLMVTRQQQIYYRPSGDELPYCIGKMPTWIDAESDMYGFPLHEEAPGVKVSSNITGVVVDPETVGREVDQIYVNAVNNYVGERFPTLGRNVAFSKVCLYTMSPDRDFVIDEVPNLPCVWAASACSGHGFKFSILIGKILSEMLTDTLRSRPLDRFKIDRFAFN